MWLQITRDFRRRTLLKQGSLTELEKINGNVEGISLDGWLSGLSMRFCDNRQNYITFFKALLLLERVNTLKERVQNN